MLLSSLALGVAIYVLARQLHSHRAGLVAATLYYVTPFTAVWALWVKTEVVSALLLVVALSLALYVLDDQTNHWPVLVEIGVLFGIAFLVRRVAFIPMGAFALFSVWYHYREGHALRQTALAAAAIVAAFAATLTVAYVALARGDAGLAVEIARVHAGALVESSGNGGLGWTALDDASPVQADGRGGIALICQKCGKNTVRVFPRTIRATLPEGRHVLDVVATLPALLGLLVGLRSFLASESQFLSRVFAGVMVALSLFAVVTLAETAPANRVVAALVIAIAIGVVWLSAPVKWERGDPRWLLPVLVCVGLAAGYLYRDRILYVTYFQDLFPYVAILSAIGIVEWWDRNRPDAAHWYDPALVVALLVVLSGGVAAVNAYPYQPETETTDWMSVDDVQAYGEDINDLTDPGERVLTAQPLYVIESDRQLAGDLSRRYYAFRGWPESGVAAMTEERILDEIDTGDVPIAIYDPQLQEVFDASPRIEGTVTACYSYDHHAAIEATGGQLLTATGCHPTGDP
jgi:exosortase/archaeosortase